MDFDRGPGMVASQDGEQSDRVAAFDEAELARGVGAEQVGRHRRHGEH
jgi:hypothetical protein